MGVAMLGNPFAGVTGRGAAGTRGGKDTETLAAEYRGVMSPVAAAGWAAESA